ncbi:hypothetical protein MUP77_22620 [Candidatus Bathyarchaeota archaeon]|nr:hypothetical protein [Candidatus Bathyarchaeota archaeon]
MVKIAERLGRSSGTVKQHIGEHNSALEKSGSCHICSRVGSKHADVLASRGKAVESITP